MGNGIFHVYNNKFLNRNLTIKSFMQKNIIFQIEKKNEKIIKSTFRLVLNTVLEKNGSRLYGYGIFRVEIHCSGHAARFT